MNQRKVVIISVLCTSLLFVTGFCIFINLDKTKQDRKPTNNKEYPLLAQRLFVENPSDKRINFSPLRKQLNDYFESNKLDGSVYFEYLPTGTSVRVNPDTKYRAASLIKLPVAMELYKSAELNKINLNDTVKLKQEWLNNGYGKLYEKGVGYQLTLKESSTIMLQDSDNTALRIIIDATKNLDLSDRALNSLDIELNTANDGTIDIGTRAYSSFLKCLYFACYNNKQDSQEILEVLTNTPFNNRLVAGISDKNIKIAHKIGVFNSKVQSDCGIVYLDDKNYVICVMISGDDNSKTNSEIAYISKIVFDFIKK